MPLEQQVTSLELSQQLKKLGLKQKGYNFYWAKCLLNETEDGKTRPWWLLFPQGDDAQSLSDFPDWYDFEDFDWTEAATAFTSSELGELLWEAFEQCGWEKFFFVYGEVFGFKGTSFVGELGIVNFMRDPNMAAKMLIYIIENKLITC